PDERTEEAITEMQRETRNALAEVVAESSKQLISKREIVRTRETELGNLAADAMRDATGADIAVINSGGLRADLPQGEVTREDVLSIFPFGNIVEKIEVRGSVIEAMLEHSVRYLPAAFGGFLDVSGLTFDLDANAKPGSRVSNVLVQGRPLSPEATYTLALNDFEAAGGDGYEMLKGAKELGQYGTLEDIFSQYLQEHGVEGIALGRISVK
ncbi:MAG: 5'-nucleotidase C-terminal domain-containing protein, partial [Selenomonadaceae bacterium]|nr:5'-nucleotidase C-terminal domain-containing protein [Selenomonadaceae bacterium]